MIEQAKLTYFSLGKAFEKQIITVKDQEENQIKALKEHGKQLVKYGKQWKRVFNKFKTNKALKNLLIIEWNKYKI